MAGVAAAEEARFGVVGGFLVQPFVFQVALRFGIADEAAFRQVVPAETGGGEVVDQALRFGRGEIAAVGVVGFAEDVEVAVGAVAFDDEQPVQGEVGLSGFDASGQAAPGQRQGLFAPKTVVDDGVAGKEGAAAAAEVGEGDDFEGGETAGFAVFVFQQQDVVFFQQVAAEEFGRGAAIVAGVEAVEAADGCFGQFGRGGGSGGQFVHGSFRVRQMSQMARRETSNAVAAWLAKWGASQPINHSLAWGWFWLKAEM